MRKLLVSEGWARRKRGPIKRIPSRTIFGGFAPFTATWLIAQTGDPLSPAYYLMATALLSIIALMVIARRGPADGQSRPRQ